MKFSQKQKGFTLIELITVIAIIMILMGLLLPAFNAAKEAARRAQAKNDVASIVTAVNAYYTEYGTYPVSSTVLAAAGTGDVLFGAPAGGNGTNDAVIDVLCCPSWWTDPSVQNPRKISFLSANNVKTSNSPKAGISTSATSLTAPDGASIPQGAFVDPWGDPYVVFIDSNYDNNISTVVANYYHDWSSSGVNIGVGVCSLGKDGKWGTNGNGTYAGSDDIVSWQ